jgi:hypothetical protein
MQKVFLSFFLGVLLATTASSAQQPEYLQHFDPAKGFKPAQANLTEIFLQIAGSLEFYGSPEPYLRHMQEEHKRIDRLYEEKTGKPHTSRMPSQMTDAYIDRLIRNWNTLSKPLQLDAFAKEIGRCMREGIMGTRLSGTFAVQILNEHQKLVAAQMQGTSSQQVGFEDLKKRLEHDLEFDKKTVTTVGYDVPRRDAVRYALVIDGEFHEMFDKIDSIAKPEKAAQIKEAMSGAFLDLGYMAESELEIAILESALKRL